MNFEKIRSILPSKIRTFRNSKGWTQEILAEAVDIHPTYISRIESGKKLPTLYMTCRIASALEVGIHELFMDDSEINSLEYKRKKLIAMVSESKSSSIELYSVILKALDNICKNRKFRF
jgi:transcriptional regulator with XRE-family HTH domain